MDLYVDVLLFENFIVNGFLLLILNQILKIEVNYKRLLIAATIGSLYTLTMVIPDLEFLSKLVFKVLVAVLMIYILNKTKDLKVMIKSVISFFLLSILLSGFCLTFVIYKNSYNLGEDYVISEFSFKFVLLSIMIIYLILFRVILYIKDKRILTSLIYDVTIIEKGIEYKFKAFLDTGNELTEPATCLPVIIVEDSYLENINFFKKDIYNIPYKAINGHTGILKGFIPDEIYLKIDEDKVIKKRAIICLCKENLSRTKEFNGLLSRGIL
ncbi:sigma-E processing peptidase SpoIIGA [Clostridium fallax]|uniref:Sporulation sigma-E factor-processing peptidase n=1 Tax=Clostridium fallax TaxID=1533 RepID=A0A1M4X6S1_9CLOT|nr:sigma-E processing peptidase SpoIIGA [Clostridium fallax]SHE89224.1 stage II sporulation protein GA (sporulation sigma-E factor processing peptidase) [Clostridium fallax]SQB07330.1 sporulation factor SpoIIGA [Clostridium fallax]